MRDVQAVEPRRVLLGFFNEDKAIRKLESSQTVGDPVDPFDDREDSDNPESSDDPDLTDDGADLEAAYGEVWQRARNGVHPRAPFHSSNVDLSDLPETPAARAHVEAFLDDPHTRASIDKRPADSWELKMVPIENIVAIQPSVTTTAYRDDVPSPDDDPVEILEFGLPVDPIVPVEDHRIRDEHCSGWQFVSRSPNVSVSGPDCSPSTDNDNVVATVTFEVTADPNFLYVAHFGDRYILKNGYHRTYQLMQRGHTHVPAVVLDAKSYGDTGGEKSGFFDRELVMGGRPPMVTDFDTPAAVEIDRRAKNRVLRIISEKADVLR